LCLGRRLFQYSVRKLRKDRQNFYQCSSLYSKLFFPPTTNFICLKYLPVARCCRTICNTDVAYEVNGSDWGKIILLLNYKERR